VQDKAGGVEATQGAGAGEREERVVLHLLLGELPGVVDKNYAAIGIDMIAQGLDAILEEEHHGGIVVFAATIWATVEQVADRVDADDVYGFGRKSASDRCGDTPAAIGIEQHLQLRRGNEIVAR